MVVAFIDDHRDRFGVAPICRVLSAHGVPIAPSGYYAFKSRPVSARALRDAELVVEIERVFHDRNKGRGICGARKVWRLLAREGIEVGRGRVERLMRAHGLRGIRRGKQFVTTRPDTGAQRPVDHVKRDFHADRPNALWVVDFTYVPTWSGMAFTAFVTDVFSRRIVGGAPPTRCPPNCRWTPWRWRCGCAAGPGRTYPGSCITPIMPSLALSRGTVVLPVLVGFGD